MPELTPEQQFRIRAVETTTHHLNERETKHYLVEVYKLMIHMDNRYRQMIANKWGISQQEVRKKVDNEGSEYK